MSFRPPPKQHPVNLVENYKLNSIKKKKSYDRHVAVGLLDWDGLQLWLI